MLAELAAAWCHGALLMEGHSRCLFLSCNHNQKPGKQETTAPSPVGRKSEVNFNGLKAATE